MLDEEMNWLLSLEKTKNQTSNIFELDAVIARVVEYFPNIK